MAEEYVTGLLFPVAIAVLPDGTLLVTEKSGTIRVVRNGVLDPEPVARLEPHTTNERGLFGVQLMPNFPESGELVVTYTPKRDLDWVYVTKLRWTDSGVEVVADPWFKLPSSPDTDRHYGGNIRFDATGKLYISASDLDDPEKPQDKHSWSGTILRFESDGSIPADNPTPGSPVYARGFRNTFDFDIGPDGEMYGAENGHHHHDELNHIVPGGNYGWPLVQGRCDHVPIFEVCDNPERFVAPLHEFRNRTGPTGLSVYDGELMPELQGNILYGGWHSGQVHRFKRLSADRVTPPETFFVIPGGPHPRSPGDDRQHLSDYGVVDVEVARDGAILVLVTGLKVGTIYRIAPADRILQPDLVVSEGDPRVSDDDLCQVSRPGSPSRWYFSGVATLAAFAMFCVRRVSRARRAATAGVSGLACLLVLLTAPDLHADSLRYGGKVGANLAFVNGDNDFVAEVTPGFAAGAAARYSLIDYFAVQAELLYAQKGSGIAATDARFRSHYLTLPILAEGMLPLGPLTPRLFVGPAVSVLLAAKTGDQSVTHMLHRFELGVFGGLGLDVKAWDNLVTLDVQYERGITELFDPDAIPAGVQYETNWNNVFYVMVGLLH